MRRREREQKGGAHQLRVSSRRTQRFDLLHQLILLTLHPEYTNQSYVPFFIAGRERVKKRFRRPSVQESGRPQETNKTEKGVVF